VRVVDADTSDQAIELLIEAMAGASVEIEFEREDIAQPFAAVLTRREVSRQTVDYAGYADKSDGSRTGYLVISEFRDKTKDELRQVFSAFGEAGITSLVIDLRGNRGGDLSTIGLLGSLILGDQPAGMPFIRFQYSDLGDAIFRNSDFRTGYDLTIEDNANTLQRVHVITSNITCSASEVLINSLRAYIDVQLTGITTCGKPYGFYGRQFEEKSMLWAINFTSANANGEDDFADGLGATCVIPDYEIYPYSDFRDQHLATAMNYLDNNSCQLPLANAQRGLQARTDKTLFHPIWRPDDEGTEHLSY
jgi:C-terminal processing protease CtpA/Prc